MSDAILLTHGLNLNPARMDALAAFFRTQGLEVFPVALSGHRGDFEEFKRVSADVWIQDVLSVHQKARAYIQQTGGKLFYCGFSLGGLLGEVVLNLPDTHSFDGMILLAPALVTHSYTHLIRAFSLLAKDWSIPSLGVREYIAHEKLPLVSYESLFLLQQRLDASGMKNSNIPTLVFIDPDDALVSGKKLRALIKELGLSRWRIHDVDTDEGVVKWAWGHLIIDPHCLGQQQWEKMTRQIGGFFNSVSD